MRYHAVRCKCGAAIAVAPADNLEPGGAMRVTFFPFDSLEVCCPACDETHEYPIHAIKELDFERSLTPNEWNWLQSRIKSKTRIPPPV